MRCCCSFAYAFQCHYTYHPYQQQKQPQSQPQSKPQHQRQHRQRHWHYCTPSFQHGGLAATASVGGQDEDENDFIGDGNGNKGTNNSSTSSSLSSSSSPSSQPIHTTTTTTTTTTTSTTTTSSSSRGSTSSNPRYSKSTSVVPLSLLERSFWEDDRKPRRDLHLLSSSLSSTSSSYSSGSTTTTTTTESDNPEGFLARETFFPRNDWGIHRVTHTSLDTSTTTPIGSTTPRNRTNSSNNIQPLFPSTVEQVAESAVRAIQQATMEQKKTEGRISIEVDGARYLMSATVKTTGKQQQQQQQQKQQRYVGGNGAGALRRLALIMAQKLAVLPYNQNGDHNDDHVNDDNHSNTPRVPVTVYFNTIKQTMLAAYEYRDLSTTHALQTKTTTTTAKTNNQNNNNNNVTILTLGQDLPQSMSAPTTLRTNPRNKKKRSNQNHSSNNNDHDHYNRGYVLVVQPTDYNDEHQPPGPSIGTMEALQRLTARASIMGFTVILIAPRFLASPYYPPTTAMLPSWQQTGGGRNQQNDDDQPPREYAAAFGGLEPARQPSPWFLRDFTPPVWSWIGQGLSLAPPPLSSSSSQSLRRYTRVALLQSELGGPWHVFGARQERLTHGSSSTNQSTMQSGPFVSYDYLASTKPSAGRPTRQIMQDIYMEFHQNEDDSQY